MLTRKRALNVRLEFSRQKFSTGNGENYLQIVFPLFYRSIPPLTVPCAG